MQMRDDESKLDGGNQRIFFKEREKERKVYLMTFNRPNTIDNDNNKKILIPMKIESERENQRIKIIGADRQQKQKTKQKPNK